VRFHPWVLDVSADRILALGGLATVFGQNIGVADSRTKACHQRQSVVRPRKSLMLLHYPRRASCNHPHSWRKRMEQRQKEQSAGCLVEHGSFATVQFKCGIAAA
jgi:hypothetical protein